MARVQGVKDTDWFEFIQSSTCLRQSLVEPCGPFAKVVEWSDGTGSPEHNVKQGRARKEGNPACCETKAKGTHRLEPSKSPH